MRIKLLKTCIVGKDPVRRNSVIESNDPAVEAEMKALVKIGYAVETKDKLVNTGKSAQAVVADSLSNANKGDAPSNANKGDAPNDKTFDPAAILAGTVPEITAGLESYSVDELIALRDAEKAGKDRQGVLEAIAEFDLGEGE